MSKLTDRLGNAITSVVSGFDRIVFKGFLRPLMYPDGAMSFLRQRGVRNKDFKSWAQSLTGDLTAAIDARCRAETGRPITKLGTSRIRKEEEAHRRQVDLGISQGVIGAWSCVEAGQSYRSTFSREHGFPHLRWEHLRCKHLYLYLDHPRFGFMYLRIQTWFPYQIQVSMNGREWLRRQLNDLDIDYCRSGNKFFAIDDPAVAQRCLDEQVTVDWISLLDELVPDIFPTFNKTVGPPLRYTWTTWQSEWATDCLCRDVSTATATMETLMRHAMMTGTSDRILRYMARPLTKDGQPYRSNRNEIKTRTACFQEGVRIRHWVDANSVKAYNDGNVLRLETTINDPGAFKVMRTKEDKKAGKRRKRAKKKTKERLPLRKSVVDLGLRAEVAQGVNNRFADHLATFADTTAFAQICDPVVRAKTTQGRRVRALDLMGKDRPLLEALADERHDIRGLTNADLRNVLTGTPWAKGMKGKQLAARISRHIRLLRDHGLLRKMPKQKRYLVTRRGRQITTSFIHALNVTTEQLARCAA